MGSQTSGSPDPSGELEALRQRLAQLEAQAAERGDCHSARIISQDYTDHKQAEDALREREQQLRVLFEKAADAIFVCDSQGDYIQVNEQACRSTGYDQDELLRMNVIDIDADLPSPHRLREFLASLVPGQPQSLESRHRRKDGSVFPVEITAARLETPAGTHTIGMVRDITQRKQYEAALERRIIALTLPLDDAESIAFADLFNLDDIQKLQDQFARATGVASIITNPDGTPITAPSNFCHLCKDIIRRTEKGLANCFRSDAALGRYDPDGPIIQPCLSGGLWDAGAAITVGGKHAANWLIGQVRDETQTEQQMRAYAREIGADEALVVEAFREVPAMSRAQFEQVARALHTLANQLSTTAYQNVQQARFIAQRKQAEDALRDSEARMRSIFRAAPVGIGLVVNRVIQDVNEQFCDITGYTPQEVIGQNARILYPTDEDYEFVGREKYRQIASHGTGTVETRMKRKDGTIIDVILSSTPLDPNDLEAGVTFTTLDITDRRRAEHERDKFEAQLRQAQKMEAIGQLAGGVAHDFNNILTAIFGNVELAIGELESSFPGAHPLLDGMHQIEKSAHRASELTRQLLAFSRRQIIHPEVVDLNRALRELEKMLRRLITENVVLKLTCAPHLQNIRVDPGQLEQLIVNLVVNARDAMPDGGRLTLETQNVTIDEQHVATHPEAAPGPHVLLAVSDTGCGMDRATLERIFEPFFTTKPRGQGTGLGLSTAYGIVKQSGGSIDVYSEPGRGTTFRVYLPAVEQSAAPRPRRQDHAPPPRGSEKILVCEDDTPVRELTTSLLRDAGYTVLAAGNAQQALQLAQDQPGRIDLLIADVIMPGMNGRKLSDTLHALRPDLHTLFVSGYTADVIAHHGVLEDNVDFLEKPYSRRQLLQRVRAAIDRADHPEPAD